MAAHLSFRMISGVFHALYSFGFVRLVGVSKFFYAFRRRFGYVRQTL